jgi:two-component system response regulator VanR
MYQILVVDDEKEIADLIALYLQNENYIVTVCYDGLTADAQIAKQSFDLAILDVMLPEITGLELCRRIRQKAQYPVIMLTARDGEMDKITGLTIGADDYMTKPFQPLELVARVKAQLRRCYSYHTTPKSELLTCKGLVLDLTTHTCTLNEKPLSLTRSEFAILAALCRKKGQLLSAEELLHEISGEEYYNRNSNTVTVHIRHLREKMKDSFEHPKYIKTVWGCGYKIED